MSSRFQRGPAPGLLVLGDEQTNILVDRRAALVTIMAGLVVLGLIVAALLLGDFPISLAEMGDAVLGRAEALVQTVLLEWRLPRGDCRGDIRRGGGLIAAAVIYVLALRDGLQGFRFIMVGIGVSAILASFNTWLPSRVDVDVALFASAWGAGTLNAVTPVVLIPTGLCILVLLCLLPAIVQTLRHLSLGNDAAASTGAAIQPARLAAIGLVSTVTAVSGPIAFMALSAPQIARRLSGTPEIPLVTTGMVGGVLLLGSDIVSQHVIPLTVPVGMVTVVVGGLYLVWLLVREARRTK